MGLLKIQTASKVFLAAQSDTEQKVSLETTDTKSLVQSHFPSRKLGTRVPVPFLRTPPPTHVSRSFPRPSVKHTQMFRVRASRSSPSGGEVPLLCSVDSAYSRWLSSLLKDFQPRRLEAGISKLIKMSHSPVSVMFLLLLFLLSALFSNGKTSLHGDLNYLGHIVNLS